MIASLKQYFNVPGTPQWLLKYELVLMWRNWGIKRLKWLMVLLLIVWAFLHIIGFFSIYGLVKGAENGMVLPAVLTQLVGALFWILFTVILSQTLAMSVNVFFTRGDLDLLLSSPINPRTVLMIRSLGIGFGAILLPILLVLPFAHAGLVAGRPSLITIYPSLVSMALFAAGVGVLLTMFLVKLMGARRAKTAAQILGALIGAAAFLVSQIQNLLGSEKRAALMAWVKQEAAPGGMFEVDSLLWWPARAFLGEILPALAFFVCAIALFLIVVNFTHQRFVTGAQESTSVGEGALFAIRRKNRTTSTAKFAGGLAWVVLRKEWKLIARDPKVISETLLQVLYMTPMLFAGFSSAGRNFNLLVPGCVMIVAMLVGNLAWLTVAAEDAPELIGTSPIEMDRMRFFKGLAAALPPLAMLLPLVIFWLFSSPKQAIVLAVCASCAAASSAACHILNPRKADRREMRKRGQAHPLASVIEMVSAFGWAGTAYALIAGPWWVLIISLPIAAVGPLFSYGAGYHARRTGVLA
jgi:ABC-2 type transport system permease protein